MRYAASEKLEIIRLVEEAICQRARLWPSSATPHRWSAAYNDLGLRDREASLRICPTSAQDEAGIARQYNFGFRAADAAASPYLALAAIVDAGAQGLEEGLAPPPVTQEDLSLLSPKDLNAKGYVRLPETLPEALLRFENNQVVREWAPKSFPMFIWRTNEAN